MLSSWCQKLLRNSKVAKERMRSVRRETNFRPALESLEGRRLLAFTTPISFPVGSNPAGIAVGDFNADGRDDMAVVNTGVAGSVSVLLSTADGTFAPKVDYAAGANPFDATAGDLNGDGKLDLVVVGSAVDVLLGNGDGTFGLAAEFAATPSAHSVKIGDFNNDGKLDVGTMNVNSASVHLGNGDGSIQAPLNAPVAGNNINLVIGDYDRDGNLDMATSNTNSIGTVNVLRGHGDGSFDNSSSYYAFSAPVYLATGDFNDDGYLDFAVPNSYVATSMSVLINNGDGTYGAPHTYGIAQTGFEIEVEDFNNDGYDDFAVRGGSMYMVSHGKGDGTFYPSVNFPTPSGRFEAGAHGDFNGDGAVDLAYPSTNGVTVVSNDNADYQSLAGAVTFKVTAPATTTSGSVLPMTITAVDANGDIATGFRGLVYISSSDPAASTAAGYAFNPLDAGIPYVFTAGDAGSHTFTGAIRLKTAGDQTVTVSAPNMTSKSVTVNVTGQVTKLTFGAPTVSTAGDSFSFTVSAIDTTGAVAPGYSSTIRFSSTDTQAGLPADYTFTPEDGGVHTFTATLKSSGSRSITATEVGGTVRGAASINVTPQVASSLVLAGGAGPIGFLRPITIVARDAYGNVATSYNGVVHFTSSDPLAELPADTALANGVATVNVRFLTVGNQTLTATDVNSSALTGTISNTATPPVPASFVVADYPNTIAGQSHSLTVTVRDSIGQRATGYTGTVYFTSTDMQAGLPSSYTFTAADAGSHTFSATLKTAGIQSITVRDLSGALIGTQGGIDVSSSAFSTFSLSVPNGADSKGHILVTAGETISLTVRATDAFGNSVSNYAGTVNVSSTDSAALVPGNYTFTPADGGTHTFQVELRTATPNGVVWDFNVVDVADATTLVTKTNFEAINGAASTIKLATVNRVTAGDEFSARATVLDAYGNTVKNYFGTVHLATSSSNASLPTDYTFDGVDGGVHDFFVQLNTSGSQSLTISDTASASVIGSASVSILAAAPSAFEVTTANTVSAGSTLTITVKAVDQFGNVSDTYRGTVAFATTDVSTMPADYSFTNKDSGVHVFTTTLVTTGLQSIGVNDLSTGAFGVQRDINVTPGSVASFAVTGFSSATAGQSNSFTITAKDAFGNVVTNYAGTVNFSSTDVQAGLPASYTFTSADSGTHTFAATLKTAGTQSITIKDSVNAAASGSIAGIAVTASPVIAAISMSSIPATTAGVAQSVTVTATDAYGNLASGYRGTVSFSSSDAKASLPASYTFTAADAGKHTFSVVLKTAAVQSVTVRDTAGGWSSTKSGISVSAAAASSFLIGLPATITAGSGFKFTVTAVDAYGNIATGYRGKIQTSGDTKGGSNSYSFSSKDNGVATVSYTFTNAGVQTLKVVDSSNNITVSVAVTVVAKK